jgi:hypothetical protein
LIQAAEVCVSKFLDSPVNFGAVCIEAKKEEWRVTKSWGSLLADHINFIITNPGLAAVDEDLAATLDLVSLLTNKLAFINYHKRHLAKRLLNPIKSFESKCHQLEKTVMERMKTVCESSLLTHCLNLLSDHDSSNRMSSEFSASNQLELVRNSLLPISDFDMRYLSKRVWSASGVWCESFMPVVFSFSFSVVASGTTALGNGLALTLFCPPSYRGARFPLISLWNTPGPDTKLSCIPCSASAG